MKKTLSIFLVTLMMWTQTIAQAESFQNNEYTTADAYEESERVVREIRSEKTPEEIKAFLSANVDPAEQSRIARELAKSEAAGTLEFDFADIANSVKVKAPTGSGFHGDGSDFGYQLAISVIIVSLIVVAASSPYGYYGYYHGYGYGCQYYCWW